MTWTADQVAMRDEWDLAQVDADPRTQGRQRPYTGLTVVSLPRIPMPPLPAATEDQVMARLAVVQRDRRDAEALTARYLREVPLERAMLAMDDPAGEADAVVPITDVRGRQILLEDAAATADRLAQRRRPFRAEHERESGRDLLTRLGADPSRSRGAMRCPAHEDRSPSLSWRLASNGTALIRCHAGCTFADILQAIA